MTPPPPLFAVSSALDPPFAALPHILDLVTRFLVPETIDSAVYLHLHRVLQRYEASRPYTVGAMDGAAATAQLELLNWLHTSRTEGCSSLAFRHAATSGHVAVLEWLYTYYPERGNPRDELIQAAEGGHLPIVTLLVPKVQREQIKLALEAAAACGQVAVLDYFLQQPFSLRKSLLAAARTGQAPVVSYLMAKGLNDRYAHVNPSLLHAAEKGHSDVVHLLLPFSDDYTISEALTLSAANGHVQVVTLLLNHGQFDPAAVARAVGSAALNDHYLVAKTLLGKLENEESSASCFVRAPRPLRPVASLLDFAFESAVEQGHLRIVELLIGKFSRPIGEALLIAGAKLQFAILVFLLDSCDAQERQTSAYSDSLTSLAELAAKTRSLALANLLVAKCPSFHTGSALRLAVDRDDWKMVRLFVDKSTSGAIQDALVQAVVTDRDEMVQLLLKYTTAEMMGHTLLRVASTGHTLMLEKLLQHSDPGGYTRMFDHAAEQGLVELLQLLLDKMNSHNIRCALISAAIAGQTEVVKLLMMQSDITGRTCAFEMAVVRGQVAVVELLRTHCEPASVRFALSAGDAHTIRLLRSKRARLE